MALSPHEYYLATIGAKIDVDGFPSDQPYQCVDLFKDFCINQVGKDYGSVCPDTGYARDIWYHFDEIGLGDNFEKVPANRMVDGDWAVWDFSGPCPYSHVAMFRVDNGNGTGIFLGQNQTKDIAVSQVSISYNGVLGGLRPNIYKPAPAPTPTKSIDEVAREVINGDWGNGEERKQRLTDAGYNYDEVQARVNEILAEEQGNLTIGTKVRATGEGNASCEGDGNVAYVGNEGTITDIREGQPYPYLISDNEGPLGWYKAEDLEII